MNSFLIIMNTHIFLKVYQKYIVCSVSVSILFVIGTSFPHSLSQEQISSIQNTTDDNSLTLFD